MTLSEEEREVIEWASPGADRIGIIHAEADGLHDLLSDLAQTILSLKETIAKEQAIRAEAEKGSVPTNKWLGETEKKLGCAIGIEGEHWEVIATRLRNLIQDGDYHLLNMRGNLSFYQEKLDSIEEALLENALELKGIRGIVSSDCQDLPHPLLPRKTTPPLPDDPFQPN
ncbi:MAG: hypothetical protein J7545_15555 [Roseofilum sp. SBFL]|uniref:hypothetical protein n=1 Tax=Roseofilum sp. SBFL TaxID=2821496 RepID=UPI001B053C96|nr:hypothetical protein [Roseofilum sp. SBFL]MBP0043363.1 hypothetical protein [Roseofilum sp. SBFL]